MFRALLLPLASVLGAPVQHCPGAPAQHCPAHGEVSLLQVATDRHDAALKTSHGRPHGLSHLGSSDFQRGDAAWRERLAELARRFPRAFPRDTKGTTNTDPVALAAAAPLTVLYVLSHYHERLFPGGRVPSLLRVHVIGASYPFEGRGDWRLLGEAMPPGTKAEVSLVLGTPDQDDGVPKVRVRKQRRDVCRDHGAVRVVCVEQFYQGVAEQLEPPHLAVMFNPGFPQVHRRTWDASLLFLLKKRIPSAVSTQVTSHRGRPVAGEPWDAGFTDYADEDFPVNTTLMAYGADSWGATGSPFPIVEQPYGRLGHMLKNGVIELFQGVRAGAQPAAAPSTVPQGELKFLRTFDWRDAERKTQDDTLHDEMRGGLETPVSESYVTAADNVYLRYLEQIRAGKDEEHPALKDLPDDAQQAALGIMKRMRRLEPLSAKDWVFLKTALNLD